MNVYTVEADPTNLVHLTLTDILRDGETPIFDGRTFGSEWTPQKDTLIPEEMSDFYDVEPLLGVLGTKRNALLSLEAILPEVEILNLYQEESDLVILNVTNVIDCWAMDLAALQRIDAPYRQPIEVW